MNRAVIILVAIGAILLTALSSVFVVDERERVLVLQFGQIRQEKTTPGLGFRIPFIQEVVRYDDRILGVTTPQRLVTMSDQRRLEVDAFVRWRIADLRQFRTATADQGEAFAAARLESIVPPLISAVLGQVPSTAVLSAERTVLMNEIRDRARVQAANLGIDILDVRLTRTDLPGPNLDATFARMRAEREREAADEVARGNEAAQRVRATADRTVVELTSDARRQASIVRGEADAERNGIYAEAFGADPEFFAFTRSLTAYERALRGSNSSIVMQPDSEFFDYLRSYEVRPPDAAGTAAVTP
jgi:modulator of FtsH protease HflC